MNIRKIKPASWYMLSLILLVLVVSALAYSVYVPKLQELEDVKRQISLAKQRQADLLNTQVPQKITATDKAALAALVPVDFEQARFLETIHQEENDSGASITSIAFTDGAQGTTAKPNQSQQNVQKPSMPGMQSVQGVLTEQQGTLRVVGQYGQIRKFVEEFSKMSRLVSLRSWNLTLNEQVQPPAETVKQPTDASLESAVSDPVTQDPLSHDKTQLPSNPNTNKVTSQTSGKTGTLPTRQTPDPTRLVIQQIEATPVLPATPPIPQPTTFTLEISFTIYDVPTAKDLLPALAPVSAK